MNFFVKNLQENEKTFLSALYTSAQRSHHHHHRLGFIVSSLEDAVQQIQLRLAEDKNAECVEDVIASNQSSKKIVFVFSGMGTQWWGMARDLMQSNEIFAAMIKVMNKSHLEVKKEEQKQNKAKQKQPKKQENKNKQTNNKNHNV